MIVCAGLTPAWQQIVVLDSFQPGEVNRARQVHWCASGKVLNAGIAVHRLGGPSVTLAPIGKAQLALFQGDLNALGLAWRFVATDSPTRVCTTLIDRSKAQITELVENGHPLRPEQVQLFREAYCEEVSRAEVAILIGSLPQGTPASFYRELLEHTPCPAILDFRGEELLACLDLKPFVVKPNRKELAQTLGRPLETDRAVVEAMQWLNRRGAQWVVVTEGSSPVWITSQQSVWRADPIPVGPDQIVNPIGCGDALAAGLAWATRAGRTLPEAVAFGLAAAWANLRQLLPCRFDPSQVFSRAETVRIEPVCPA